MLAGHLSKFLIGRGDFNTYLNSRVSNHMHGLIIELKERMDSRQDRPVIWDHKWSVDEADISVSGQGAKLMRLSPY